jgi:endonuclease/exonuclease/phosphatase family metal-dependent hydrolase
MKLLSWNIQWGRGADGETTLQRTVSAIRTLGDFDVICQEVAVGFAGLQGGAPVDGVAVLAAAFPATAPISPRPSTCPTAAAQPVRQPHAVAPAGGAGFPAQPAAPAEEGVPSMPRVCLEVIVDGPPARCGC